MFELTSPFISYNQYDLLKCLVKKFGRSDVKAELQEYNAEVDEFNQKTTVGQLMEVMERQQRECRDDEREILRRVDIATIKMKFGINYKGKTLYQLYYDISTFFECEDYVLTLSEANLSAHQLTWYTAKSAVEHLTQKATEKKGLLDDIGVLALKVGPDVILGEVSQKSDHIRYIYINSLFFSSILQLPHHYHHHLTQFGRLFIMEMLMKFTLHLIYQKTTFRPYYDNLTSRRLLYYILLSNVTS